MTTGKTRDEIAEAYSSEPWWYDLRGFFILIVVAAVLLCAAAGLISFMMFFFDARLERTDLLTERLDLALALEQPVFRGARGEERDAQTIDDVPLRGDTAFAKPQVAPSGQGRSKVGRRVHAPQPFADRRGETGIRATNVRQ